MDGELGIYNKFGGSGKYNIPNLMDGGGLNTNDNNEYKEKRIKINLESQTTKWKNWILNPKLIFQMG